MKLAAPRLRGFLLLAAVLSTVLVLGYIFKRPPHTPERLPDFESQPEYDVMWREW